MSDEGLASQTPEGAAPASASIPIRPTNLPVPAVCPYLLSADGSWRSTSAAREHRCTAVMPPSPLAAEKQRRLCLTADHVSCATFVAATEARATTRRPVDLRRPIARTTPLVLDQGRLTLAIPSIASIPMAGQGVLIGLLGVAFGAVLIARLATGGGSEAGVIIPVGAGSPSPSATEAAVAATPPPATAKPTAVLTPTAKASPTLVPTGPTAKPTATPAKPTSYKVKSGDTLSGIAAEFGTTVKVLAELNGIKDPSKLHIGQVIKLP